MTVTAPNLSQSRSTFDVDALRAQFPILSQQVNGKPLVYLDNAATTQKPQCVIDEVARFYREDNANVHRGVHALSARASRLFDGVRQKLQRSLNAGSSDEIVYTHGTTEAINLVVNSFGSTLKTGDEIIISGLEHHANIVPWMMLRDRIGISIKIIPVNELGEIEVDALPGLITERTRLIGVNHVSNALGTINPVAEICRIAREHGIPSLVDGAQGLPHMRVDVQAIGCDFYTMSGHKAFGPSGVGALYARRPWLEKLPPFLGGGDMIESVSFDEVRFAPPPSKFETGTPNIEGTIGMGTALDWLDGLDWPAIEVHEQALLARATDALTSIPGLRPIGTARNKAPVLSFVIDGIHPHDLGTLLDAQGIAVRTGHHCAMPILKQFGVPGTVRASFSFYNTLDEVDALAAAVERAKDLLS